jgi:hypothetical protein
VAAEEAKLELPDDVQDIAATAVIQVLTEISAQDDPRDPDR